MSDDAARAPDAAPRRTVSSGAAMVTVSNVVTAAGGGLIGVVVARALGPGGAGSFNVVLSAVVILQVFSTLGLEVGVSYYVGGGRWPPADALRQAQVAAAVLGALAALIGFGAMAALEGSAFEGVDAAAAALGAGSLPFVLSWTYSSYLALAVDNYELAAIAPVAQTLVTLVLTVALAPLVGLTGALVAFLAGNALVAVALVVASKRRLPRPSPSWLRGTPRAVRRAALFGTKAQLSSALQFVNQRIDLLVLNAVASGAAVGHYAIAVSVTMLGMLLPRALSSVVVPRIASLDAGATPEERDYLIGKSARHGVIVVVATALVLAAAMPLIPIVYGGGFGASVGLGFLLLPGVAAFGYGNILSATVVGKGAPGYALRVAAFVTPPTLVMYATLIPAWHAVGAAIASVLSYTATAALMAWYFRKVTGLPLLRTTVPRADDLRDYRHLVHEATAGVRRRRGQRPASTSE